MVLRLTTVWRFRPKKRTIKKLDMVFNSFLPSIFHFLDGSPAKSKLPSRGELIAFDFTVFHTKIYELFRPGKRWSSDRKVNPLFFSTFTFHFLIRVAHAGGGKEVKVKGHLDFFFFHLSITFSILVCVWICSYIIGVTSDRTDQSIRNRYLIQQVKNRVLLVPRNVVVAKRWRGTIEALYTAYRTYAPQTHCNWWSYRLSRSFAQIPQRWSRAAILTFVACWSHCD